MKCLREIICKAIFPARSTPVPIKEDNFFYFTRAMSGTEFAFTAAAGGATVGLTLSTPAGWVVVGVAGIFSFFGAVIVALHEDGETARAKQQKLN